MERVAEQASRAAHGWQPKPEGQSLPLFTYYPYLDSPVTLILITDDEPNVLDDIFDELEEATDMNALYRNMHLSAKENGWLALHIGRKIQEQKESLPQMIEKELEVRHVCPSFYMCTLTRGHPQSSLSPRTVRNFRIVRVKDARVGRRKALRTAQITVWDVLGLGESFLVEGGRYLVSIRPEFEHASA